MLASSRRRHSRVECLVGAAAQSGRAAIRLLDTKLLFAVLAAMHRVLAVFLAKGDELASEPQAWEAPAEPAGADREAAGPRALVAAGSPTDRRCTFLAAVPARSPLGQISPLVGKISVHRCDL